MSANANSTGTKRSVSTSLGKTHRQALDTTLNVDDFQGQERDIAIAVNNIRQGCKSIVQREMMPKPPVCRAANNPWPEWPKILKTDYGQQEAIAVFGQDPRIYETTVKEFIADEKGVLKKVKCVKLDWKKDEKTGRMNIL